MDLVFGKYVIFHLSRLVVYKKLYNLNVSLNCKIYEHIFRYAVCGPMEVIHLNAEGLKKYCEVYGDTIHNVSTDFKGIPEAWKMDTPEGVAEVIC